MSVKIDSDFASFIGNKVFKEASVETKTVSARPKNVGKPQFIDAPAGIEQGTREIYVIAGWEVRIVKNCDLGLENAARGAGHVFFTIHSLSEI